MLAATGALLAGCGLPRSGPNKSEIFAGSVQRKGDAFVVAVNDRVTRATAVEPALGFDPKFIKASKVGPDIIRPGDRLVLSIYENVEKGLFGTIGGAAAQLTDIQVDASGYIFIPYAGRIRAAGRTPEELRKEITAKLDAQTPDPQVIVRRVPGDGATVTLLGAVAGQGVYPIQASTLTLTSMLAKAGGVTIPPEVAKVKVTRGKVTGEAWLKDLYADPKLDIALRPGDKILVQKDDRAFTALGATGSQTRVPFETPTVNVIEALARVGGLNALSADPTGIFVFRDEPAEIANRVLGRNDLVGRQRMIYVLDLTEPNGMFLARDFLIRDGDTVYVTEAPFVQWNKTLSLLNATVNSGSSLVNATK